MTEPVVSTLDVLCGRGGATNNHFGNKRFRVIVGEHQARYLAAKKKEKATIAREVVSIIQKQGGRFLKRNGVTNTWEEVSIKKATEKSSQALREGLDVRHNTFKRRKPASAAAAVEAASSSLSVSWEFSSSASQDEDNSNNKPPKKKRARVDTAAGKVIPFCEISIPDLKNETLGEIVAESRYVYQPPKISEEDCPCVFQI